MGVIVGVGVIGGGDGSQIMGVTLGGGGGSQITGPRRQETLAPPYKIIIARMAFCKSLDNLFHGAMFTSSREGGTLVKVCNLRQGVLSLYTARYLRFPRKKFFLHL